MNYILETDYSLELYGPHLVIRLKFSKLKYMYVVSGFRYQFIIVIDEALLAKTVQSGPLLSDKCFHCS